MAEETEVPAEGVAEANETPSKSSKGLIIVFVGIVVLIETGMFFFLVPSADEISAIAQEKLINSVEEGAEEAEQQALEENKVKEHQLGQFGETFSPNKTNSDYMVTVDIYGLVLTKDVEKLEAEIAEKSGRIRDAISRKIRNSDIEELKENQLGLLERRILTTCNHLLDEDLLLGVGFNGFRLIEQ